MPILKHKTTASRFSFSHSPQLLLSPELGSRESFPSQEELSKPTYQELQCRKFIEMSKREAINAERGGFKYNAD
ncbi:hypothetical protein LguiA_027954 [Lonicera macranthoides]